LFQCQPVSGLGFRRGSYRCVCREGFYYPDTSASLKYFNGTDLEEEYAKILEVRRRQLLNVAAVSSGGIVVSAVAEVKGSNPAELIKLLQPHFCCK
jgi:hypothetical protein